MKIETISISKIKPWPRNPRRNHDVDAIARSIESFGYLNPIIVQAKTYRVIAGHGRLAALRKSGVDKAPVIVADLDDQKADLYTLADNKLAELSEWDFSTMADLLLEFDEKNLDTSLLGFSEEEVEQIMNWTPPNDHEEEDPPPIPEKNAISQVGDTWELGNHRLMCGDSTSAKDVSSLMGDGKALLMATDPPYGVAYDNTERPKHGIAKPRIAKPRIANDNLTDGFEMQKFLESMLSASKNFMADNAAYYFWNPMLTQGTYVAAAVAAAAGILIHRQIIWVKSQFSLGWGDYHWRHELCFYGWRQGFRPPFYGPCNQDTIWEVGYDKDRNETGHPTVKPTALWERPIRNHLNPGEIAYEPFSGSGSQIIAGEKEGRRIYAMEITPQFVDVAVRRWQNFTKKKAKNLTRKNVSID